MKFLPWLLIGSGVFLNFSAARNRNPKDVLLSVLKNKPMSNEPWYPLPGYAYWVNPTTGQGNGGTVTVGLGGTSGNRRETVVNFAKAQLGEPYVFGAAGPNSWDCSGLTMKAYREVGIELPHHAASQQRKGTQVAEAAAQPGDLVFWGPISGHVAIYLGNGQVIHAPHTGDVVRIAPIWGAKNRTFRRYL